MVLIKENPKHQNLDFSDLYIVCHTIIIFFFVDVLFCALLTATFVFDVDLVLELCSMFVYKFMSINRFK